jgi:folylpolyglutamate synthase/dihydropteroate synthase
MLNNRSAKNFVNIFKNKISRAFTISIPEVKSSYNPSDLTTELNSIGISAFSSESLEDALKKSDRDLPLLITGSLYLTGYVLRYNRTIIN